MPTYDYKCTLCGHMFEEFEAMSAAPLLKCPECGKDGLKRVFSTGAGMIFKGQGFYLTDYKKRGSEPDKTSAKKDSPATPAKTDPSPAKETKKESPKKDP